MEQHWQNKSNWKRHWFGGDPASAGGTCTKWAAAAAMGHFITHGNWPYRIVDGSTQTCFPELVKICIIMAVIVYKKYSGQKHLYTRNNFWKDPNFNPIICAPLLTPCGVGTSLGWFKEHCLSLNRVIADEFNRFSASPFSQLPFAPIALSGHWHYSAV